MLVFRPDGDVQCWEAPGMPFGMMDDMDYDETSVTLDPGDCLLLVSDGAYEVRNANGDLLGVEGLISLLKRLGYPHTMIKKGVLEEELLRYSNALRLDDDVTAVEIRLLVDPRAS